MKTVDQWLEAYGESHTNPLNKTIHWVAIPLIMTSLLGLLAEIPFPYGGGLLHWGTVLIAIATLYYAALSIPLAIGMAAVAVGMLAAVSSLAALPVPLWATSLSIFVAAWVAQFIGHKVEGKKPSFFEDLQFLLIGPMWLLAHLFRKVGLAY